MENLARVRRIPLRELYDADDDEQSFWAVDRFARALSTYKKENDLMDYTDMLEEFSKSDVVPILEVLFVDEAQDLSLLQWDVVRRLAANARRVVIAGDDDQAIYRWAGADVETLIGMPGDIRVLSQSWRVPRSVQRVAADVVGRIRHRREKVWEPRPEEGLVKYHAHIDSVDFSHDEILVLGRNRYMLKEFERTIRSAGYLYEFQGVSSIRPKLLEAVLCWERIRQGKPGVLGNDARRMFEMMTMNVGWKRGAKLLPAIDDEEPVDHEKLVLNGLLVPQEKFWYDALDKMSMVDVAYIRAALRRKENLLATPRIRLSTIHGIKGGEANRVVVLTDMAARTFEEARRSPEDEARVWYVAATRARQELHIVAPSTKRYYEF